MEGAPRVLVVDDDAAIRMLCRINLELDGFAVVEAASAEEARRVVAERAPDVVLLDFHVGSTTGGDLIREIRAAAPGARVAFLTGSADGEAVRAAGADAVIGKPFAIEDLRETVELLVGARR